MKVLVLLTCYTIVLAQTNCEIPPPEDYLTQLKFALREEKTPGIVNYLLENSLIEHDITTLDIIRLSNVDRFTLDRTIEVFNYFNIPPKEAFSVDSLENVLLAMDIEFDNFYRSFTHNLGLSDITIQQALADLNINQLNFYIAVVNHNYIYDILRNGTYDEEHVNAALQTIVKTQEDVYTAVRDILLERALALNSTSFMNVLREFGWNRKTSLEVWKALNITTRNVYEVEKFREIFTNISNSINENLILAVFVDNNKLALHELLYNKYSSIIDGSTVKIEAGLLEVEPKFSKKLGKDIVELTSKSSRDQFVSITDNYDSSENCTYATVVGGEVVSFAVEVDDLVAEKTEGVVFNLGSPVICEGHLYGLARAESNETITFDRFYLEAEGIEEGLTGGSGNFAVLSISTLILNTFLCCFVLL